MAGEDKSGQSRVASRETNTQLSPKARAKSAKRQIHMRVPGGKDAGRVRRAVLT